MAESSNAESTIVFKVQNRSNLLSTPVWRKVEVENANCPVCRQVMEEIDEGSHRKEV